MDGEGSVDSRRRFLKGRLRSLPLRRSSLGLLLRYWLPRWGVTLALRLPYRLRDQNLRHLLQPRPLHSRDPLLPLGSRDGLQPSRARQVPSMKMPETVVSRVATVCPLCRD